MALNTYSLVINHSSAGQFASNVTHWQFDDSGFDTTQSAAQALQNAWLSARKTTWLSMLPNVVSLISLNSRCETQLGGFDSFGALPAGNVGARAGAISVSGLCPCIIHYPVNLSLGRGRTFLPGIREADIDDGIFTTGYRSAIETALTTMFDPLTLTGGGSPTATFGYLRRPSKVFVALANSILSENLGTQRRRMRPA